MLRLPLAVSRACEQTRRAALSSKHGLPTLSAEELAAEAAAMDAEMESLFGSSLARDISSAQDDGSDGGWAQHAAPGINASVVDRQPVAFLPSGSSRSPPTEEHGSHSRQAEQAAAAWDVPSAEPKLSEASVESSVHSAPQPIINITYNIHHHHYYAEKGPAR